MLCSGVFAVVCLKGVGVVCVLKAVMGLEIIRGRGDIRNRFIG